MLDDKTMGLWCRKDHTWYYLESGPHIQSNALTRVKKALLAKGLIEFDPTGVKRHQEPYITMSHREAKEKEYTVQPIFLNAHVKQVYEDSQKSKETINPWT